MKNQEASERQLVTSDAAVFASMGQTPPADVARIKAMGGEVWYERTQTYDRISDKEFFRNIKNYQLYGLTLRDPIDPTDKVSQAFLKGTAQIIRASNVPEAQYNSASYNMYAFNAEAKEYKWIGGWGRTDYNETYIKYLEKNNPTMNVTGIGAFNDFAFILYPKTASATPTSTAVAQSSVTATGTKPTAATTR